METTNQQATDGVYPLGFNLRSMLLLAMLVVIIFGSLAFRVYAVAQLDLPYLQGNLRTDAYWAESSSDTPGVKSYATAMLEHDSAVLKKATVVAALFWLPFVAACVFALIPVVRRRYTQRQFLIVKYLSYASGFYLLFLLSLPS